MVADRGTVPEHGQWVSPVAPAGRHGWLTPLNSALRLLAPPVSLNDNTEQVSAPKAGDLDDGDTSEHALSPPLEPATASSERLAPPSSEKGRRLRRTASRSNRAQGPVSGSTRDRTGPQQQKARSTAATRLPRMETGGS